MISATLKSFRKFNNKKEEGKEEERPEKDKEQE